MYLFSLGIMTSFADATERATCESFTCNSETHLPKANASTIYCADSVCTIQSDTNTCCHERPMCSSVNSTDLCTNEYVSRNDFLSQHCEGLACVENEPACCVKRATCDTFSKCVIVTLTFQNQMHQLYIVLTVENICTIQSDTNTCCHERPMCSSVNSTDMCTNEYVSRNDYLSQHCEGLACVENEPACCVKRATCDTFTCNSETHLPKSKCINDILC